MTKPRPVLLGEISLETVYPLRVCEEVMLKLEEEQIVARLQEWELLELGLSVRCNYWKILDLVSLQNLCANIYS